jgi:putative acetyltransferase
MTRKAPDIEIRAERPADHPAIHAVHRAAFAGESEARLVDQLRRSPTFDPALSLVAIIENAIVGHVLFTGISIEDGARSTPALALAPVGVLPTWQRQGVGSRLIRSGLAACLERSHRLVVVLGHPTYYPRFGFVPATPLGILCPFPAPSEAFMVLDLQPGTPMQPCGAVRYPAAFIAVSDSP